MTTIIDYGMGNLGSIKNMLKKIGYPYIITDNSNEILKAEKLILPGVGAFYQAMKNLNEKGMAEVIQQKVKAGIPLLGICLGMQLLADYSEEGDAEGLGIIPGNVKRFRVQPSLKVPHMGWNLIQYDEGCKLYYGFEQYQEARFYFVHSYHYVCSNEKHVSGITQYGHPFTSSVSKGYIHGVQFHPEKSHKFGMALLKNFIERV